MQCGSFGPQSSCWPRSIQPFELDPCCWPLLRPSPRSQCTFFPHGARSRRDSLIAYYWLHHDNDHHQSSFALSIPSPTHSHPLSLCLAPYFSPLPMGRPSLSGPPFMAGTLLAGCICMDTYKAVCTWKWTLESASSTCLAVVASSSTAVAEDDYVYMDSVCMYGVIESLLRWPDEWVCPQFGLATQRLLSGLPSCFKHASGAQRAQTRLPGLQLSYLTEAARQTTT